jgi:hypothetical protein
LLREQQRTAAKQQARACACAQRNNMRLRHGRTSSGTALCDDYYFKDIARYQNTQITDSPTEKTQKKSLTIFAF